MLLGWLTQYVVKLWNALLQAVVCDKCLTWSGESWRSREREIHWDLQPLGQEISELQMAGDWERNWGVAA